mmetsp:Transcript_3861/g.9838  ORF Transcript_3861/g.9838 Transcript_3861/m.9838 type:complete len:84 (+) Transcript_3861:1-252(+)
MGTPALTTRGFLEKDFVKVADFVDRAIRIAIAIKAGAGPKLKDFNAALSTQTNPELEQLKEDVEAFSMGFPAIGFDESTMKYR